MIAREEHEAPGAGRRQASAAVLGAIFAASFAAVYLEISLMKLVSVRFYSVFVYAIIGVALLGYGAAGPLLAVRGAPGPRDAPRHLGRWLTAFAACVLPAFLVVNAIDVPNQALFGSLAGLPILLVVYACLTLPFLCAGIAIAGAFAAYGEDANRLYFADLLGAGAGSALAVMSLPWIGGVALVAAAGVAGAAGAALALGAARRRPALVVGALDLVLLAVLAVFHPLEVHVAPDKHGPIVARAAKPGGAATEWSAWSVFGRVDVTEPIDAFPPQFGGDVSPVLAGEKIAQRMLTLDGAAPAFLFHVPGSPGDLPFLAGTSQSPAYRLRPRPEVLVIGVGGATDVLIALSQGAGHVVGVEINPVTAHATRDVFGAWVGNVLRDPRVELVVAEGRNFAARDRRTYDIVQLSGVDTGAAVGAYGLGTAPESYVYTVEGIRDLLHRLAPGGILSITRDLKFGWALRLANVTRAALLADGLEPAPRVAVLTGPVWATLLVKREPFTPEEVAVLDEFARRWRLPLAYTPGASGDGDFARVIRTGAAPAVEFDLRPSTDDWPFFFLSFHWRDLLGLGEREGPLTRPIVFLVASLAGLVVIATTLIGWPLWRLRRDLRTERGTAVAVGYFAALGAGFMLIEVALMQRFTLFLGNPVLAVATVLAALLLGSGLGSDAARRWGAPERTTPLALGAIVVTALAFASPLAPALLARLLWAPLAPRLVLTVALVAAAGFAMGMPFPAGLARMAERARSFVPWAWGINALVSVIASLASYLIGMMAGYTVMFYAAAALYVGAFLLARRL